MSLAKELQNKTLIVQTLNFQGDVSYYRGDLKQASDLFAQAVAASSSSDVEKDVVLLSKYNTAKCMVEEKRYQTAIAPLRALVQQADAAGLKNISVESTLALAEALMNIRQYPAAKKELETALATSEKLGLQVLQARSQYLLGRTLEVSGSAAEAAPHFAAAKRQLEAIRQESGGDAIVRRQDLAPISAQQ
jgi:tetratricopeptide (TPR) repeat protein